MRLLDAVNEHTIHSNRVTTLTRNRSNLQGRDRLSSAQDRLKPEIFVIIFDHGVGDWRGVLPVAQALLVIAQVAVTRLLAYARD